MASDNLSGIVDTSLKQTIFLAPGRVIQWAMYMGLGKFGKEGRVRIDARRARSPILTYAYSIGFWIVVIIWTFDGLFGQSPSDIRASHIKMQSEAAEIERKEAEIERKAMDVQYKKSLEARRNKNWELMIDIVQPLANKGHAKSQAMLGLLYLDGVGVAQSKEKGMKWVKSAAKQGNANAEGIMGDAYLSGMEVKLKYTGQGIIHRRDYKPDFNEAIIWYERAIENGNKSVKENLEEAYKMKRKEKEKEDCFRREKYNQKGQPKQGKELRHAEAMCKGEESDVEIDGNSIQILGKSPQINTSNAEQPLAVNNTLPSKPSNSLIDFIEEKSQNEVLKPSSFNQKHINKLKALNICIKCNLSGANLSSANLSHADLSRSNLTGSNLSKANLTKAKLWRTDLTSANLSHASLVGADMTRVILYQTNLAGADLTEANLLASKYKGGVNLTGANLTKANLIGVDFSKVDLTNANLTGADLSYAKNIYQLSDTAILCNTKTPWGLDNSGC
jgi:uncharacterized protein YjbI with pentapeptide repeats